MNGPIEYIKEAFRIYTKKENFIFFARIMAVLTIIATAISYLQTYISQFVINPDIGRASLNFSNIPLTILYVVIAILSFIFFFYKSSTIFLAILNMNSDEKEVFKLGFKYLAKLFLIMFVVWLIVLFGLVLFIIPAILFMTWYQFSVYLVLDKNLKIGEALKQSKVMVKGRFWKVLGRNAIFSLTMLIITAVLALIPYVGDILAIFITPLFMLPVYLLYRDLSAGFKDSRTV